MYCLYYDVNTFALDVSVLLAFHSYYAPVYSNAFQIVQQKEFLYALMHIF